MLVPTFADWGVSHGQGGRTPTAINLSFLDQSHYFPFQAAPYLISWGWVYPGHDALLLKKTGSARNQTWDLWVRSQELWPLDNRGNHRFVINKRKLYSSKSF
jgi:hypothetical protein